MIFTGNGLWPFPFYIEKADIICKNSYKKSIDFRFLKVIE